ncbi:MAG: type II CAAX endopeptidase family protein [Peptococcaceae bacterium]
MKWSKLEKKQLRIYIAITFGVPIAMSGFMWMGYIKDANLIAFPMAQMMIPAVGVILVALRTTDKERLPKTFYKFYLVMAFFCLLGAIGSVLIKGTLLDGSLLDIIVIFGSVVGGMLLLSEEREKRETAGLMGANWKLSMILLVAFVVLYFLRMLIIFSIEGQKWVFFEILAQPKMWVQFIFYVGLFCVTFIPYLGEEYGWRYFLQPLLMKRFGKRIGVLLVGGLWGLWHAPLDFFYYVDNPSMGWMSLVSHLSTCICIGIFFSYAYLKTRNIWVPVILHFINNSFAGIFVQDVQTEAYMHWGDVFIQFIVLAIVYDSFIFSTVFKKEVIEHIE